jgi:hypothetical protein
MFKNKINFFQFFFALVLCSLFQSSATAEAYKINAENKKTTEGQRKSMNTKNAKVNRKSIAINQVTIILNGSLSIERIDQPETNVPGNRPIYWVKVSFIPEGKKSGDDQTTFRFDPYDSGKSFNFGHVHFMLFVDPNDPNKLIAQTE